MLVLDSTRLLGPAGGRSAPSESATHLARELALCCTRGPLACLLSCVASRRARWRALAQSSAQSAVGYPRPRRSSALSLRRVAASPRDPRPTWLRTARRSARSRSSQSAPRSRRRWAWARARPRSTSGLCSRPWPGMCRKVSSVLGRPVMLVQTHARSTGSELLGVPLLTSVRLHQPWPGLHECAVSSRDPSTNRTDWAPPDFALKGLTDTTEVRSTLSMQRLTAAVRRGASLQLAARSSTTARCHRQDVLGLLRARSRREQGDPRHDRGESGHLLDPAILPRRA